MTEEVFRIVTAAAVALATLAFVIQAGMTILLYRVSIKTHRLVTRFMGDARPVLANAGTAFTTANRIMDDAAPHIKEVTADVVAVAKSGREEVEGLGDLLHHVSERTRSRLDQIDKAVDSTVRNFEHFGDAVKFAVMKPVKKVNGLTAGITAGVATLVRGSQKSEDRQTSEIPSAAVTAGAPEEQRRKSGEGGCE